MVILHFCLISLRCNEDNEEKGKQQHYYCCDQSNRRFYSRSHRSPPSIKGTGEFMLIGLSEVKTIVITEDMAVIVSYLVGERFAFDTEKCDKLEDQLLFFFNGSGVANEDVFSIMTNPSVWHKASKLEDEENYLDLITVPVTLLLFQIALYTEHTLSHSLYLHKGITYEALGRWFGENQSLKSMDYKTTSILQVSQYLQKIPTFHAPKFQGDTLTVDNFIADVDRAFRSAPMA